jgi:hypothetical protein
MSVQLLFQKKKPNLSTLVAGIYSAFKILRKLSLTILFMCVQFFQNSTKALLDDFFSFFENSEMISFSLSECRRRVVNHTPARAGRHVTATSPALRRPRLSRDRRRMNTYWLSCVRFRGWIVEWFSSDGLHAAFVTGPQFHPRLRHVGSTGS